MLIMRSSVNRELAGVNSHFLEFVGIYKPGNCDA